MMQHWLQLFLNEVKETPLIVWVGISMGVAEVLLARVNSIWLYPTGIIGTACSILVLLKIGLFAESALNAYYLIMSIYGWVHWVKKRNEPPVKITWTSTREWLIVALITFGGWALIWLVLVYFTTSTVPVLDAFVSSSAFAGMWLLARRKIENWIVLNVSNLVAVPLLFYKQQPMFALLTIFLFVVAIFGYFGWVRIWRQEQTLTKATA